MRAAEFLGEHSPLMLPQESRPCPLCRSFGDAIPVQGPDHRPYRLCGACALISVDPAYHLPAEQEKARYETHENRIGDPGYVRHLNRLLLPMLPFLDGTMRGLDYGSGPAPVASRLLAGRGIACEDYDPFFHARALEPAYDFVLSIECFEHFWDPAGEMEAIRRILKPGGILGIMTERWVSISQFASWYYARDPTHVVFYHADSFGFICDRFGYTMEWMDETRVAILRQNGSCAPEERVERSEADSRQPTHR